MVIWLDNIICVFVLQSATTGDPKGVLISHDNVGNTLFLFKCITNQNNLFVLSTIKENKSVNSPREL